MALDLNNPRGKRISELSNGIFCCVDLENHGYFADVGKMTERLSSKQEIDRNEEAFSLLREEFSRSLMLIRQYHFDLLVRLTDYAERTISAAEGATKIASEITRHRQS